MTKSRTPISHPIRLSQRLVFVDATCKLGLSLVYSVLPDRQLLRDTCLGPIERRFDTELKYLKEFALHSPDDPRLATVYRSYRGIPNPDAIHNR